MRARKSEEWLSLGEAAQVLGIHPSTLRSWADQGIIPVHRTQGRHRRFLRSELEVWSQSQRGEFDGLNMVVENALRNTRFQVSEGRLNDESWYAKLDDEARRQYRESGRTLLLGLINAVTAESGLDIVEAEALGYEYASRGNRYGLSTVEATHAFLFFRNMLMDSMLNMFESAAVRSPQAWGNMFRRLTDFTDHVLIKLMETYQLYQRNNR